MLFSFLLMVKPSPPFIFHLVFFLLTQIHPLFPHFMRLMDMRSVMMIQPKTAKEYF